MSRDEASPYEPGCIPHRARVAFVAHCGRELQALFESAWPDARPERVNAVNSALSLAEQSATAEVPSDQLKNAMIHACMAAGVAQMPLSSLPKPDEPTPTEESACLTATFSAKVAELAAGTAHAGPTNSTAVAREAFAFARDAAAAADRIDIIDKLLQDFANLYRVASRDRWTDTTPVPPTVFALLSDSPRSWWKWW